jgi:hypothetical protein
LMKEFVKIWNMCLLNLLKHICKNALLGQRDLVKVIKNGTKFILKLIWGLKNWMFQWKLGYLCFLSFYFCSIFASILFLLFINCKLFLLIPHLFLQVCN